MGARIVEAEKGMAEAVERLRAGLLVAFPTETVYGLGANAFDADAVQRIFTAKGRPSTNPLIVHMADPDGRTTLAHNWSETAQILADRFWPGPLTLVVERSPMVPDIVTAGGPTVGLRVPRHSVALELLRSSNLPLAAPSANRSEEVSPTTAQHVADSLGPFVDDLLILDGGPCEVGLESTVVDVTTSPPRILRPGMVTTTQIRAVIGNITVRDVTPHENSLARSPGLMVRHYAPRNPVAVVSSSHLLMKLCSSDGLIHHSTPALWQIRRTRRMPTNAESYAAQLYDALREMDNAEVERIVVEEPPHGPEWAAIHDRLRRASAPKEA